MAQSFSSKHNITLQLEMHSGRFKAWYMEARNWLAWNQPEVVSSLERRHCICIVVGVVVVVVVVVIWIGEGGVEVVVAMVVVDDKWHGFVRNAQEQLDSPLDCCMLTLFHIRFSWPIVRHRLLRAKTSTCSSWSVQQAVQHCYVRTRSTSTHANCAESTAAPAPR